jgi:hypothetical protein
LSFDAFRERLSFALCERSNGSETGGVEDMHGATASLVLRIVGDGAHEAAKLCPGLIFDDHGTSARSKHPMHFRRGSHASLGVDRIKHIPQHDRIERLRLERQHGPWRRVCFNERTFALDEPRG